jgi:hypothetical protein
MAARSVLERVKRAFSLERSGGPAAACPFCGRALVPMDEVIVVQGRRYHADCAIRYASGQR